MSKEQTEVQRKTVLITGASSGIGYELALVFARNNYDLVLVARSGEKLKSMAREFRADYGVHTKVIPTDLSVPDSAAQVFEEIENSGIEIDVLINNAGIGNCGFFHETELAKDMQLLQLNIVTLTHLTKLVARKMVARQSGKILNVASTGAYQAGPLIATYYASKAYVLSFSEALANELKPFNIQVTTLCPGATKTEFAKRAGKGDLRVAMAPRRVAEIGYRGLMKNKRIVIPGKLNKVLVLMTRILPRRVSARLVRRYQARAINMK